MIINFNYNEISIPKNLSLKKDAAGEFNTQIITWQREIHLNITKMCTACLNGIIIYTCKSVSSLKSVKADDRIKDKVPCCVTW